MAYLLDVNVYLEAHQRRYGFELCPGFWTWLGAAHSEGKALSIDKVGDELKAGDDPLSAWAERQPSSFFAPIDAALLPSLATIRPVDARPVLPAGRHRALHGGRRLLPGRLTLMPMAIPW